MSTYKLKISTPEGYIYNGDAQRLIVRGVEGDLAIMAGHVPFTTVIKEGNYSLLFGDGHEINGKIGGGILNVTSEETILLAGSIEWEEKS